MSVYKRPGQIIEDNRFVSLNTQVPTFGKAIEAKEEVESEVVAPKATKKEKEKEVAVETPVEAEEVIDEKPLDMVVG